MEITSVTAAIFCANLVMIIGAFSQVVCKSTATHSVLFQCILISDSVVAYSML